MEPVSYVTFSLLNSWCSFCPPGGCVRTLTILVAGIYCVSPPVLFQELFSNLPNAPPVRWAPPLPSVYKQKRRGGEGQSTAQDVTATKEQSCVPSEWSVSRPVHQGPATPRAAWSVCSTPLGHGLAGSTSRGSGALQFVLISTLNVSGGCSLGLLNHRPGGAPDPQGSLYLQPGAP